MFLENPSKFGVKLFIIQMENQNLRLHMRNAKQ